MFHFGILFQNQPDGSLLTGDPRNNEEGCIVDIWNDQEDVYFKRMNASLLSKGLILPYQRKEETEHVKTVEESTDEELLELVNSKFFTFQSKLNSINTIPVLFRILEVARQAEKSEKIIKLVEARLAEVQGNEYTAPTVIEIEK